MGRSNGITFDSSSGAGLHKGWGKGKGKGDGQPDPGDDGVFINGISNSLQNVDLAVDGVSDALAQVVFNVPLNALGQFEISFGKGTSIGTFVDDDIEPVDFTYDTLVIEVVPEPASFVLQLLAIAAWNRRRRRHAESSV